MSGACLVTMTFLLPETARRIVGNGSLPVLGLHKLPFAKLAGLQTHSTKMAISTNKRQCYVPNPFLCISTLFHKDVAIITTTIGIFYMTCICVQASLSSIFIDIYGLGELESGLIYLPFGFGGSLAAYCTGEMLRHFLLEMWPI